MSPRSARRTRPRLAPISLCSTAKRIRVGGKANALDLNKLFHMLQHRDVSISAGRIVSFLKHSFRTVFDSLLFGKSSMLCPSCMLRMPYCAEVWLAFQVILSCIGSMILPIIYSFVEKYPPAAFRSSPVREACTEARPIPRDFAGLASGRFPPACRDWVFQHAVGCILPWQTHQGDLAERKSLIHNRPR